MYDCLVSWATVGASKYVIHMHLSNRSTTEKHKQLKYRVIEPSLNGYVNKTLLHLRFGGIAWKLVDILIIKFMTFISLCINSYGFNSIYDASMCSSMDKSRL